MDYVEPNAGVKPESPDAALYVQRLLAEANRSQFFTDAELEKVQMALLNLLAAKIASHTSDASSSVRIEVAETLMKSNLYTIGLYLKSLPGPAEALKALQEMDITELYRAGRKRLNAKISVVNHFYQLVRQSQIETKQMIYNVTIMEGIPQAIKLYHPEYTAHELPAALDYPLANPTEHLTGIEYLQNYVQALYYENVFCSYFTPADLHALLFGYDKSYEDSVFNIFRLVFTAAIGCELAEGNLMHLRLSKTEIESLYGLLTEQTEDQIIRLGISARQNVQRQLNIRDRALIQYLEDRLPEILSEITHAVKTGSLDKIFSVPEYSMKIPQHMFSFGDKMEDTIYRAVLDELQSCRHLSDKLAIIREKILTLNDLDDLLLDGNLTEIEMTAVFHMLGRLEIAALVKRHLTQSEMDADAASQTESELKNGLQQFMDQQSEKYREQIAKVIDSFEIES